jgi:Family of unknown function (DUF6090)
MTKAKKKTRNWLKVFSSYNYAQALEKILFTMVGLWLALALNNWNDGLKRKRDEKALLIQLEAALQHDLRDIEETISGYKYRADGSAYVMQQLQSGAQLNDSLSNALQSLNGYSFLSANKGAYETLKSQGMDLISNDSLRLRIATLYEVDYLMIERLEDFYKKVFAEQTIPFLYNNLQWNNGALTPVNWPALRQNIYFTQLVKGSWFMNTDLLGKYQKLQLDVRVLARDIQAEME